MHARVTRRELLKTAALSSVALIAASGTTNGGTHMRQAKDEFYDDTGAFDGKKAIEAYLAMMESFNYPIPDVLRTDSFWTCDFLQRNFKTLGMGGIFWINEKGVYGKKGTAGYKGKYQDQNFGYLGHEIFLLPGQMLPEHRHVGGAEEFAPKMESWQVRYGEVEFFGQHKGSGDETLIKDMPASTLPWGFGEDWFKSKYVTKRTAQSGKLYTLEDPETWHFQRAGSQGAIVTEYGTYHNQVEFSKPGLLFDNSKAV